LRWSFSTLALILVKNLYIDFTPRAEWHEAVDMRKESFWVDETCKNTTCLAMDTVAKLLEVMARFFREATEAGFDGP